MNTIFSLSVEICQEVYQKFEHFRRELIHLLDCSKFHYSIDKNCHWSEVYDLGLDSVRMLDKEKVVKCVRVNIVLSGSYLMSFIHVNWKSFVVQAGKTK